MSSLPLKGTFGSWHIKWLPRAYLWQRNTGFCPVQQLLCLCPPKILSQLNFSDYIMTVGMPWRIRTGTLDARAPRLNFPTANSFLRNENLLGNPLGCYLSDHGLSVVGWGFWDQVWRCTLGWHNLVQSGCLLVARNSTWCSAGTRSRGQA